MYTDIHVDSGSQLCSWFMRVMIDVDTGMLVLFPFFCLLFFGGVIYIYISKRKCSPCSIARALFSSSDGKIPAVACTVEDLDGWAIGT